jgi:hypothetical protein
VALTLVEAAKLAAGEGKTLRAGVISMFARASDLLMAMPFKDIQGNAYQYNREGALPGIAFRGVNEAYTPSTGVINQLIEALRIAGGDLDVDTFILKTQGQGVRQTHEELKVKALAAEFSRVIIKGDSTTNPREFDGWQNRIPVGSSQLVENGATSGGDPLSLLNLDTLIDQVPGCNALVMNKALRRRLTAAGRNVNVAGYITYTTDVFGRQLTQYNNIPILVPYPDNGGTEMIAFDEAGGGGGATATSIYAVNFGDGFVCGIQSGPMDVRDIGELEVSPAMRTRVEWFAGQCVEHGRAIARLRGISNAAVVA